MHSRQFSAGFLRTSACWNWKCALLSASARSAVYALALLRGQSHGRIGIILVEMVYVTLTAGFYAGLQQQALLLRQRWLGDLVIVLGVPGLSQAADWLAHRAAGVPIPHRALAMVCCFALLSALFHRHVMRHGSFLTGAAERSLSDDFRRLPQLTVSFAAWPFRIVRTGLGLCARIADPREPGVAG